jgi:hypothetical protein
VKRKEKTPFGSSEEELRGFFPKIGEAYFEETLITVTNYPFEPSIAFRGSAINASLIKCIYANIRPSVQIGDEHIFLSATNKEQILRFAESNSIKISEQSWIWSWILEPFLDTEFTSEHKNRLNELLVDYGLTDTEVNGIRNEVKEQMLKYNFDTMLWEWVDLNLYDVLCAMRVKYSPDEFRIFYWKAMRIALLPKLTD